MPVAGVYSDAYVQRLLTLRLSRSTLRASKSRHMHFYHSDLPSEAQIGLDRPGPPWESFGTSRRHSGDPQRTPRKFQEPLRKLSGISRKPQEALRKLRNLQEASGSSRKLSESSRKLSGSSREALRKFPGSSRRPALYHNIFRE